MGKEIWIKPPKACCTTQWNRGAVMAVNCKTNIFMDGMPCYVLDVHRILASLDDDCGGEEQNEVPS